MKNTNIVPRFQELLPSITTNHHSAPLFTFNNNIQNLGWIKNICINFREPKKHKFCVYLTFCQKKKPKNLWFYFKEAQNHTFMFYLFYYQKACHYLLWIQRNTKKTYIIKAQIKVIIFTELKNKNFGFIQNTWVQLKNNFFWSFS